MIQQIRIETKIMYKMYHDNIIKIINHFEDQQNVYLVLEYAPGGQLWFLLNKQKRFQQKTVKQYIRQLCLALKYIHSRKRPIIHRDIKPENLILDSQGNLKLADFGWSNFISTKNTRKTFCGTTEYLAPEMIA